MNHGSRIRVAAIAAALVLAGLAVPSRAAAAEAQLYKVLATSKTSTMQKEMNEAAAAGYRFGGVMGGETSFGGSEVVVVMQKSSAAEAKPRYEYRLLATTKTSTMQREMLEVGERGYEYCGQTVFKTAFSGKEVVTIFELDRSAAQPGRWEYRLLATSKTSTMNRELGEAGQQGFSLVGLTVAETAIGGQEIVSILRRKVSAD